MLGVGLERLDDLTHITLNVLLSLLEGSSTLADGRRDALDGADGLVEKRGEVAELLLGGILGGVLVDELLGVSDGALETLEGSLNLRRLLGVGESLVTRIDKTLRLLTKTGGSIAEGLLTKRGVILISLVLDVVGKLQGFGDEGLGRVRGAGAGRRADLDLVGELLLVTGVLEVGDINVVNVLLELVGLERSGDYEAQGREAYGEVETLEISTIDDLEEADGLAGHDAARVDQSVPTVLAVTSGLSEDGNGLVHAGSRRVDGGRSLVDL